MEKTLVMNVALALALMTVMAASPTKTIKVFISPDRDLRTVVLSGTTGESSAEIQGLSGHVLLMRDETSGDGFHGRGVIHGAWTADSQFFVAGTQASGGHQPWAHPVWVYSRAKNRVLELGKLGAVAVVDFTLKPPDVLEVGVLDCKSAKGEMKRLVIRLGQLVATERLPYGPCPPSATL